MKNTKRALFLSAVSMLLCFVMLAGTTFAWFTDTVESTGNVIKSGELKIDLFHSDKENSEVSLKSDEGKSRKIFDYSLWEPGYTTYDYFRIVNNGNLHFKYELSIVPTGPVTKLADVIDVYYAENKTLAERADINTMTTLGTLANILSAKGGVLISGNTGAFDELTKEMDILSGCIVLKMRESADNNYQNLSLFEGEGGFKVVLNATQYTKETDSFDETYDALAEVIELPEATVTPLTGDALVIDATSDPQVILSCGVQYDITETPEEAAEKHYADWMADFEFTTSADIGAEQLMFIGNYGSYGWVPIMNPIELEAGTPYRIMADVGNFPISYEFVLELVESFKCGIIVPQHVLTEEQMNGGYDGNIYEEIPAGTVFNLELRVYEVDENGDETGNSYIIGNPYTYVVE